MGGIGKKLKILLLAAAVVALSCGSAIAGWNITDLGLAQTSTGTGIDEHRTWANSINNNGDIVGYTHFNGTVTYHAAYWHNGTVTDLGYFGTSERDSYAYNITDNGLITGSAQSAGAIPDTYNVAATYSVGGSPVSVHSFMTDYGYYANNSMIRTANNAGYMVGQAFNDDISIQHPVLWTPTGTAIDMNPSWNIWEGDPTHSHGGAASINNHNQIVGWTMPKLNGYARPTPTRWDPNSDGTFNANNATYLNLVNDPKYSGYYWTGTVEGFATDINDAGQASVWYENGIAGIWQKDGSFTQIKSDSLSLASSYDFVQLTLNAINNSGVAVGSAHGLNNLNGNWADHAIMYANGTLIDLGALFEGTGWYLQRVIDVNDKGQMLVQASRTGFGDASYNATLLLNPTATPIPAALPLFVSGLAALGIFRRRFAFRG